MKEKKKKHKLSSTFVYVVGSIVICAATTVAISKGGPYLSGYINKLAVKHSNKKVDEDDWGPVVERKLKTPEKEKE